MDDRKAEAMAPLESVLRTEQLRQRCQRHPDYETESRILVWLAQALADSPRTILQTLADKILEGLHAGSAGLSLLTRNGERFYWAAIAGAWAPHIGGGTPRDFGPCGDVLDRNIPLLFTHWERRYPYLCTATPLADEGLLVPFRVAGKVVGTIWAISTISIASSTPKTYGCSRVSDDSRRQLIRVSSPWTRSNEAGPRWPKVRSDSAISSKRRQSPTYTKASTHVSSGRTAQRCGSLVSNRKRSRE